MLRLVRIALVRVDRVHVQSCEQGIIVHMAQRDGRSDGLPEDASTLDRLGHRIARHLTWARRDGIGRLIEEDNLDPRARLSDARLKRAWRRQHGVQPGQAQAVFLVGVQRSGTNMVVRGLEASPATQVHNENDRRVFHRYRLRDDDVLRRVILASRHQVVLLKPLIDSHRTPELLDSLRLEVPPLAIWAYRNVDDRARSAVAKFGDVNRQVLAEIAAGRGLDRWQAQRLSEDSLELIRRCDPASMSAESGAALFWVVRNRLFFELGLHTRSDVRLVSYESVIADPATTMRSLASFVGLPPDQAMAAHVDERSHRNRPPLDLDPLVREAAVDLQQRLDSVVTAQGHLQE